MASLYVELKVEARGILCSLFNKRQSVRCALHAEDGSPTGITMRAYLRLVNRLTQSTSIEICQPNLKRMPCPPRGYSQFTFRCSLQMMRQLPHSKQPSVIKVTLPLPSVL